MSGKLTVERIGLDEANAFVTMHHRHHKPVVGHLFSIGAGLGGKIVGVAIVGRPVARRRDDGVTAEVTRLCTDAVARKVTDRRGKEHELGVCSFLYGATARAAFALGFKRIGTYILASESGKSLYGAGWRLIGETPGRSWSVPSRPRVDTHPLQPKLLFECVPRVEFDAREIGFTLDQKPEPAEAPPFRDPLYVR